ncbi:2-oxo-4-hydroxy-4-carboxy-5-ureidoimidazoline decarboxylase-like [Lytechinus variegatus]|uniref:2-oxo-4-hydroxy-4-carboxy-5-ureidoimidazoline decarboxylase-like n=1 Tax=Lytechinus variegatus TaxID=7654 RepID=UPI001BB2B1F0|nr:2-oxo-4-hydroxy-4-carboxy-5-ureidoimidazoline decarboxylase-like [Lytechinus variegatus]XP_041455961.1 2-oxo-4-hydroxy-4-carboxy-5-ureidoimidazoline decarboxylase-like [Lytechinus variegatus]XP_041455970.1 2-oxo-4-hydroxy-4-carboxy-5-ureidoimidazoline decarboxylase-like [Lytechinus variegatus]XP_041455977.1 2-oxo-4-hydroxy-4-carboxy-5-ureidoimidazoline decarboxylase-like [Lytechinus variegatus]XP_041455986.1 2-oxo-4-hydroxy-4-carboxy-5-ureidoimidazoline decarboxylase-like [Lytechinus variega
MAERLSLEAVNQQGYEEFIQNFTNIVEHGMLIAGAVWSYRPFRNLDHLHQCFCDFMDSLPAAGKQSILRCHPNLAGKLARRGQLTSESEQEQASAGLSSLTEEQFSQINKNNATYREKFSFPFVICARENKVASILQGLETRIQNSEELELQTGVEEVKKIVYYRLLDKIQDASSTNHPKL